MRFLADHNVEALIVERLREAGHEILTVADLGETRADDQTVLSRADRDERVLVTNDKDFGGLAFLQQRIAAGIVLLRMPTFDTRQKADRLVYAVALLGERLLGSMIVVGERTIRRRRLPGL